MDARNDSRYGAPADFGRYQTLALGAGVVGLIIAVLIALLTGGVEQFFFSYLVAFIFWTGITVGSLALLMVQYVARGAWGVTIRRILEAATKTLPLMALLFVPIVLDMFLGHGGHLYHWAHTDAVRGDEILQKKQPYLLPIWFTFRGLLYFALWGLLAYFLNRWSAEQDETDGLRLNNLARNLSGPGIVIFALTVSFAATDWVMSLDPHWYSTIFGILFMGAWGLSAMSFTIIVLAVLSRFEPMRSILTRTHFHDLGKLLLAFVMLWTYFQLSQFLIIWSGNLPEEIPWYMRRMSGGWQFVGIALVLLHFALPFLLLLSRRTKRNVSVLSTIALGIIIMRFIDAFYLIAPEGTRVHTENAASYVGHFVPLPYLPLYLALGLGIGGLWLALFIWNLRRMPLLPLNDPFLERALMHGHGHGHH